MQHPAQQQSCSDAGQPSPPASGPTPSIKAASMRTGFITQIPATGIYPVGVRGDRIVRGSIPKQRTLSDTRPDALICNTLDKLNFHIVEKIYKKLKFDAPKSNSLNQNFLKVETTTEEEVETTTEEDVETTTEEDNTTMDSLMEDDYLGSSEDYEE